MTGNHAPRQSDRLWTGLSTDLCKETILMRNIKSVGGLTHGRVMKESQRALWIMSMADWAAYDDSLRTFTSSSAQYSTHKDLGKSRLNRNYQDEKKIVKNL